jgi:diaminopimelate decarboxylase
MRPAEPVPDRIVAALRGADTPVCAYVYDTAALRSRAAAVRAALPPGATLLYAVKANGHPAVVAALADATDGLEVASGGELALAVTTGAHRIVFGGPAKTDAELRAAVTAGALVNAESPHELRRLHLVAGDAGRRVDTTVRVNRAGAVLPGSHAMTGAATPFGVDEAQLDEVLAVARDLPHVRIVGFGLHAVSNNLDAAAHARFVADAVAWAVATAARHGVELSAVNVGGGLGVDHRGTATVDLDTLRAGLARVAVPPGVELIFEIGRLLAADAGWYAAEVLDLKHTHGRTFAVLRGGTHHFRLPAAWGYSHPFTVLPVEAWPYPYDRPQVRDTAVDAVGELCTPRDVLARGEHVDRLRIGDVLVFARTGAYGWDISHHDFLRHPPPQFIIR